MLKGIQRLVSRSMRQLLTTVDALHGIGLRSLHENIDITSAAGRVILSIHCPWAIRGGASA
jgi:hypothetical protein